MVPCLICYFIFILFYTERKESFLIRNIATILPLMSNLSGKIQRFTAIDKSIEMSKNS